MLLGNQNRISDIYAWKNGPIDSVGYGMDAGEREREREVRRRLFHLSVFIKVEVYR